MDGILHHVDSAMYQVCQEQGDDAFAISDSADGICMQYHNCAREFCDVRNDWNLPEYTAQVYNTKDLQVHTKTGGGVVVGWGGGGGGE